MDKRDKNIEDFFNKSLEQFSDAPSDKVWAGIAQQMDAEQPPFYKRWMFWITTFMVMAMLSLLFGGYYTTQKAISQLTVKTNQLEEENRALKLALTDCSVAPSDIYSEKKEDVAQENSPNVEERLINHNAGNQARKSSFFQRNAFFTPYYTTSFQNLPFSNFKTQATFDFAKTKNLFIASQNRKELAVATSDPKNEVTLKGQQIFESDISNLTASEIIALKKSGFHDLAQLGSQRFGTQSVKTNFSRKLPSYLKEYEALNLTKPIGAKRSVRFGWSFGFMNTFTEQDDLFGPGYNSGFTSEFPLSDELSLTAAINHTQQNYEIKLKADNQSLIQNYPGTSEITNIVTSINQHSHYLEIPIGLKWYFKADRNRTKFYVNPAVAWQFYFPQKFKYELATNTGISTQAHTNDQYFGYLGSMQMQIGMEKPFLKKRYYQVGLWAEKSIIPIGVENRNLLNVGIRGAIMFN